MKRSYTAGGIVINSDGQVLIVNQNYNSWSLPKGHIDEGEDALSAAKREIYEESGIEEKHLTLLKDLGCYERFKIALHGGDDMSELKVIQMFLFKSNKNHLRPLDPTNPEAKWVEQDKVSHYLTHEKDVEFYENWIVKLNQE